MCFTVEPAQTFKKERENILLGPTNSRHMETGHFAAFLLVHVLCCAGNSFSTSGDALCCDRRAPDVLDCRTARNMFYAVHNMSYYVWSSPMHISS